MRRFVSLTLLIAVGLAGCQSLPWRKESAEPLPEIEPFEETLGVEAPAAPGRGLRLSTEQRFTDVPLPVGVKEDLDRTFVYESADLQIGRMVYTSKASVNALAQFYLDEAPVADWERASLIEAEVIEMVFVKPGRRLTVRIRDLGVTRGRTLTITLIPEHENGPTQ